MRSYVVCPPTGHRSNLALQLTKSHRGVQLLVSSRPLGIDQGLSGSDKALRRPDGVP